MAMAARRLLPGFWNVVLAGALFGACAGRANEQAGSAERLAALEQRLSRLEEQVRSGPREPAVIGLDSDGGVKWPLPELRLADAEPPQVSTAQTPHESCLQQMEASCRSGGAGRLPASGGTVVWRKLSADVPAPTARERACLAKERSRCDAEEKQRRRVAERLGRLDAELVSGRVDRAFSDFVTGQLEREPKLKAAGLRAECTTGFCRLSDPHAALDAGRYDFADVQRSLAALEDAGIGPVAVEHAGKIYFMRAGRPFPE